MLNNSKSMLLILQNVFDVKISEKIADKHSKKKIFLDQKKLL